MRRNAPYIVMVVLVVGALMVMEYVRASAPDMRPSYEHDSGTALGADLFFNALPELLGGTEVAVERHSPYVRLRDDRLAGHTYVFVSNTLRMSPLISERLLAFVERGNLVFLSSSSLQSPLADSLGMRTQWSLRAQESARDSVLHLTAPGLSVEGGYRFDDRVSTAFVSRYDTLNTTVLGTTDDERANFVRIERGEGAFFVHAAPRAFSNYNLVTAEGARYATAVFSHLPTQPVIWDGMHKPQRTRQGSPLRFIQETRPLAFAYYTLLVGALLFVTLGGRRRQRAIPVVRPPANQTVRFARAVAGLWHERGDDARLVERRARHLRESLRLALHEPELELSEDHAEPVARRLGLPPDDVTETFALIRRLESARKPQASDLIELDRRLSVIHDEL